MVHFFQGVKKASTRLAKGGKGLQVARECAQKLDKCGPFPSRRRPRRYVMEKSRQASREVIWDHQIFREICGVSKKVCQGIAQN
jgi:hypothetical protein